MSSKADWYFTKAKMWRDEINALRAVVSTCGLEEDVKWGCPCYTLNGKNVVLIHMFKEYCALLFFKGVLMKDDKQLLVQQTPTVQAARQMRFTGTTEIVKLSKTIKAYVAQAIEVEKAGLKVQLKRTSDFKLPEEFASRLKKSASLKKAFYRLTPGRQRAYIFFFSQAKLSKTREARVAKYEPKILAGKGMDDE